MDTNIMKRNGNTKKLYIVAITFIIVLFAFIYYMFTSVNFSLIGNGTSILKYGEKYQELGFIATNGFGQDVSKHITINGQIDEFKEGNQKVEYIYEFGGVKKVFIREVLILENPFKEYDFIINGDNPTYICENGEYEDLGAYVVKKDTDAVFNNIEVKNKVNTYKAGEYEVVYSYTENDNVFSKTRRVIVLANDEKIESLDGGVTGTINLDFSKIEDYTKTILPDGNISQDKKVTYKIGVNGQYHFLVFSNDKQVLDKTVNVQELANNLTCNGELKISGTYLNIVSNLSDFSSITWDYDGKTITGNKEIRVNEKVTNANVTVLFKDGASFRTSCNITDKRIYNFTYDGANSKSLMQCQTYSPQDRANLEAKLRQAVNEAGYGTRAGVVEAARFLVGALDYKVPYLGPRSVDSRLGRYETAGLNIGNNAAWGCRVSGYIQGLDCTNFITWAFRQNGLLQSDFFYTENMYKIRDVMDKIRVGDLMISPCSGTVCQTQKFVHIAIIIGIDKDYVYIAESTTGYGGGLLATRYPKDNMPSSGTLSLVKLYHYSSDGNVTDMWMS